MELVRPVATTDAALCSRLAPRTTTKTARFLNCREQATTLSSPAHSFNSVSALAVRRALQLRSNSRRSCFSPAAPKIICHSNAPAAMTDVTSSQCPLVQTRDEWGSLCYDVWASPHRTRKASGTRVCGWRKLGPAPRFAHACRGRRIGSQTQTATLRTGCPVSARKRPLKRKA